MNRKNLLPLVALVRMTLVLGALGPASAVESQTRVAEAAPTDDSELRFDDNPLEEAIEHPDWFKQSFLDLKQDLAEAQAAGKTGIAVYFGQSNCAYCKALMEMDFGKPDIAAYTQEHFDVISINIWGSREVIDPQGNSLNEREYAVRESTNFTPSFIFYNLSGEQALRLRGFHPPYRFRAALKYVAEGYYQRERLRDYMLRADPPPKFDMADLNEEDFFSQPPHMLDRSQFAADKPLVVFFEQGKCHACDILHTWPLREEEIAEALKDFEAIQLDMWSNTPVLTPDGQRLKARQWAAELGLHYAPTLMFFDERGKEIMRLDSLVHLYRLRNVLEFVRSGAYQDSPSYMIWRGDVRRAASPP